METSVKDTCRKRCWQFFLCLVFVVMIAIAGWLLWKYAFGRGSGDGNGTPGVTPDQCALRNGTVFGAYCYVSPNLQMTWPDAEAYCVGLSGHLASIKSQPENDFVFNMMFNPTHSLFNNSGWIGLKRTGGDIGWSDGGNTDAFTYWNFDDPNPNAGYDCGAQVKSPATRWSLFFCSDVKYFCCKFPLASIPLKPRGLVATPGGRSASVTFYAPTSDGGAPINRYFIKATPGGKTSNFSVTGNAPYTGSITGLTEGVSYTLQVAAVNDIGMGPYSDPSSPVVPYAVAPGAPQGVVAQPGSNAVAVLFSAPADNGGSPVTYYLVNHTTTTSNTVDRANITESPAIFTQNLLAAPAPMTFTVQAFTRVGPSPIITVSGVVLNPALPAYIPQPTAVAGNGFVDLTWTTVTADNFTIFSDIKSVPNTPVPAGVNPTQTYRISGLSVSICYRFSVFATNSIGNGAPSPYSVAACPFAVVPTAPLNAQAVNQGLSAVVNFTAPTSDGLAPITSYTVTAAFDTNGTILGTVSGTSSPITYSPLPEGEDIYFKVAAVNSVGTGPSVNTNYITVAPGVAQPPTAVTATASAQSVVLSWVAPTNDGGRAVSQYNITAIPAAPGFPFIVGNVLTATVPPDTSAFWLSTATNYTFTVRSINALGYGDASVASNAVVPLAQKPFPPTITGVNATRRGVNVSFTAPANNGGSLITRYILNGTNGSLTFVGGSANFAVATQLVPNQFYSFTLRASNAVGDSGYSGVSASIQAGPDVPNSPRNIAASPNDGSITVTFTPAADDGGSPVTSFTVYISPGGYQTVGAQSPLTVGGVPNDYSYVATVVATNAVGNSLPSVASNAVTPTGKSINKAAIIGGVIGGLVLLCLVGICVCYSQDYLCFRKKDQGPVMFQEPGPSGNQSSMNLTAGQMTTDTPSTFAVLGGVVNDSSSHQ